MNSQKEKDKHPFCVFSFQEVRTHSCSLYPGELDSVLLQIKNQKPRDVRKVCYGCTAEPPQRGTTLPSVSHFMQEVITVTVSSKDANNNHHHSSQKTILDRCLSAAALAVTVQKAPSVTCWHVTGLVGSQHVSKLLSASIILYCYQLHNL